jgi:hypothetical protein
MMITIIIVDVMVMMRNYYNFYFRKNGFFLSWKVAGLRPDKVNIYFFLI